MIGNVVLYSFSVILQRLVSKSDDSHPRASAILFQLITGLLIGGVGLALGALTLPAASGIIVPLIIMIVVYAAVNVWSFEALQKVETARYSTLVSTRALVTALVSALVLGEMLTLPRLLGIILVLAGVVVVHKSAARFSLTRSEVSAVLVALGFGVANVLDRYLLQHIELYTYISFAFVAPAILLFFTDLTVVKPLKQLMSWGKLKNMLLLSACYAGSSVMFFMALARAESAAQVSSYGVSSVILVTILAAVFLKERENLMRKVVAAVVTCAGLWLLS